MFPNTRAGSFVIRALLLFYKYQNHINYYGYSIYLLAPQSATLTLSLLREVMLWFFPFALSRSFSTLLCALGGSPLWTAPGVSLFLWVPVRICQRAAPAGGLEVRRGLMVEFIFFSYVWGRPSWTMYSSRHEAHASPRDGRLLPASLQVPGPYSFPLCI